MPFYIDSELTEVTDMRKMRRFKQIMSEEDTYEAFRRGTHGVMAIMADDDYPYAVPLNYWFDEENKRIYFHGARDGMREEYMGKGPKCSFCVVDLDKTILSTTALSSDRQ